MRKNTLLEKLEIFLVLFLLQLDLVIFYHEDGVAMFLQ